MLPVREEAGLEVVEGAVVAGLTEVGEFVDDDVFDTGPWGFDQSWVELDGIGAGHIAAPGAGHVKQTHGGAFCHGKQQRGGAALGCGQKPLPVTERGFCI